MQALILAAGMGKRLGKYTKDNTKCMVKINNETLLQRAINSLKLSGVNKLILVVGYKSEILKEFVVNNVKDMEVIFVENKEFAETNNIYSLYLAREYLEEDDTILLESDLIFEESLIKNLVKFPYENAVTVAQYEPWMDGTVTLVDENNNIYEFVEKKNFDFKRTAEYFKTVNIYKFSKEFSKSSYIPFLEAYIKAYGKNEYYELVLKAIAHLDKAKLKAFKLTNEKWYEIDDAQDLDIAKNIFSSTKDKLSLYKKRYGGYWRFDKLKDFCYLVNPYFPTRNMIDKIKYSFETLLTQYPSGIYVQSLNASRMFNVDEKEIIVGNGAAELINYLKYIVKGKIAVPSPTFNEYIRCFPNCEIINIDTSVSDYNLNKKSIIDKLDLVDNIAIINPDNPSGAFLQRQDLIDIIEIYNKKNKYIIIDESFIDFADQDKKYTLMDSKLLNKYKNLIIIKSISKSYGVPGLRLGVLASGDENIIKVIKENISIWNINSFAEYFLQIITLYKKEYNIACNLISKERSWLYSKLEKINYLTPYKSQANYILCKVDKYKAEELATKLVDKYDIYIKDLTGKSGFEGKEYIRVAVKNREENEMLIDAFQQLEYSVKEV